MSNLINITKAAKILGVTSKTLREWDKQGKLCPSKTPGGHRRYDNEQINKFITMKKDTNIIDDFIKADFGFKAVNIKKMMSFWTEKDFISNNKADIPLAILLTNVIHYNNDKIDINFVLAVTKEIWNNLIIKNIVTVNAIQGPTSLIYYLNKTRKGNLEIKDMVVVAQTKKFNSKFLMKENTTELKYFQSDTFEPYTIPYFDPYENIDDKVLINQNAKSIANEINCEIIEDIYNNIEFVELNWNFENVVKKQVDKLFIITDEFGIKLLKERGLSYITEINNDHQFIGTLGDIDVYFSKIIDGCFLLGRKSNSTLGCGFYYTPYILCSPVPLTTNGRSCITRYDKKFTPNGQQYYCKMKY